jgi:hypothetical protein
MATFWITKHALTQGILKADGCEVDGKYVTRARYGRPDYLFEAIGKDAFPTEKEAKTRAIELAKAKLQAIERQEERLREQIKEWGGKP